MLSVYLAYLGEYAFSAYIAYSARRLGYAPPGAAGSVPYTIKRGERRWVKRTCIIT